MSQTHLNRVQALNLGSFYTPDFVVKIVYEMLLNALSNVNLKAYTLLDSSCGYGNFLQMPLNLQIFYLKTKFVKTFVQIRLKIIVKNP